MEPVARLVLAMCLFTVALEGVGGQVRVSQRPAGSDEGARHWEGAGRRV